MLRLPVFTARFPTTVKQAVALKTGNPDSAYVAGGTDLYPNMKRRQQTPGFVVDVRRIPDLQALEVDGDGALTIGAGVTLRRLIRDERVRAQWPVLAHAASRDLHPASPEHGNGGRQPAARHPLQLLRPELRVAEGDRLLHEEGREDLLGRPSLPRCWAVQSSDLAPVMVALEATVTLAGPDGTREIPAEALYKTMGWIS